MKGLKVAVLFVLAVFANLGIAADFYETLQVGDTVLQKVYVLSANASALSVKHSRGLTQVALADLPEALQVKYGYDRSKDAARSRQLERQREKQVTEATHREAQAVRAGIQLRKQRERSLGEASSGVRTAFASFGSPAIVAEEVDLRPIFRSHGIGVRIQRGPSCSVHAIVAALEYQYAEYRGQHVNVSEPHLVQATSMTLGRATKNSLEGGEGVAATEDEGFALEQVFQAIRGYGLVIESTDETLDQEAFTEAFRDVTFSPFRIPGERTRQGVENLVHVLNSKMPVVVGLSWPEDSRVRNTALLSKQPPAAGAGHAVTLVGYRCDTGRLEDTKFIFRNSWGMSWGAGGYGFFTYEYLMNNLFSAYVVELR